MVMDSRKSIVESGLTALAVALFLCLFAGCEVIGENERLIAIEQPVVAERSHVLIEFTGFRCVNCPKAAATAEQLRQTYGERLITVAMHPASNPFTQGVDKYNYTCAAADTYYLYMGGNATTPFPTGNIDMLASADGFLSDYPLWATRLAALTGEPAIVELTASLDWQPDTRQVTIRTACRAAQPQQVQLALWLVEDSIQGAQAMPDGSVDTQYIHRHMLRNAIGDEWGVSVTAQLQPDEQQAVAVLPEAYEPNHCAVVAVVMDADKTIINAKQIPIQ